MRASWLVIAAIVLLAIAAAPRLRLDYAPSLSLPEVGVSLTMPATAATDPVETTNRWIVPVEAAIRSLGDVIAMRGDIASDTANLTVRFRRGVDPELKTARLASELASVRARLPRDARLTVYPAQQNGARPSAFLALTRPAHAERIAEELRGVEGTRDVQLYGARETELWATSEGDDVFARIAESVAPRPVGETRFANRVVPVSFAPSVLRNVETHERLSEATSVSRLNGKPAVMLAIFRDDDVPLFRFDAALRERARELALEEVWSEAAELRALLTRLGVGALLASLVLAIGGLLLAGKRGLALGLQIPLAVAIAIHVALVTGARVDALTLLAATVAIAACAVVRPSPVAALFVFLLPVATTLATGRLAPLLAAPALTFAAVGLAGIAATLLLRVELRPRAGTRVLRNALRNSAAIALAAVAVSALLFAWFGARLDPRRAGQAVERGRLYISLALPAGTTLGATTDAIASLERSLAELKEVRRFWSVVGPSRATVVLELANDAQSPERLQLLRIRLHTVTRRLPGSVTVSETFERGGGRFSDDLEDRPEADEFGTRYRVLLQSTDAAALRSAYDELATRLARINVRRDAIEPEWAASSARLELVPKPATSVDVATRVAGQIAGRTLPPRRQSLPDGRTLRVALRGAPQSLDEAPQRADLFSHVFDDGTIPALFDARSTVVVGRVTRELGRFVLPVTIAVPGYGEEKLERRKEIDRTLSTMPLPAGTVLQRPSLEEWSFSKEKLRLLGLVAFLPVLLFAAGCIVLNSAPRAFVAAAPAIAGVAFAAPLLLVTATEVDEIAMIAIAAAVCGALPSALRVARAATTRAIYREVRGSALPLLLSAVAVVVLLAVPALAPEALRSGWRGAFVAGAGVLFVSVGSSALLPAALLLTAREVRRRGGAAARAARSPWPTRVNPEERSDEGSTEPSGERRLLHEQREGSVDPSLRSGLETQSTEPSGERRLLHEQREGSIDPSLRSGLGTQSTEPSGERRLLHEQREGSIDPSLRSGLETQARSGLAIEAANVTKTYAAGFKALRDVSFELQPGIIGLLGPNGAGKTTLLRTLTGLLVPTRGRILFRGVAVTAENLAAYRRHVGFLPQEFNAYAGLTAAQFLDYWAIERGMSDAAARAREVERLLALVNLTEHAYRRVRDFSGGMRQRIGIARALIGDPPLIVVDEPTTGLDIEARAAFRELMLSLAKERIVILSTHIAGDVEATASRILVIVKGRLRWDGTPESLIAAARGRVFETTVPDGDARPMSRRYRTTMRVRTQRGIRMRGVVREGEALPGTAVEPTLEEAYLALAGDGGPPAAGAIGPGPQLAGPGPRPGRRRPPVLHRR